MESLLSLHGTPVEKHDTLWPSSSRQDKDCEGKVSLTPNKLGMWINGSDEGRHNYRYEPNTTTMKSLGNPSQYQRSATDPHLDVELQDFQLWSSFSEAQTEMIVTKTGRRMFPGYRIKLSGLDPNAKYCLLMDVVNVDQHRYKFQNGEWRVAGRGEPPIPQRFYLHPNSPSSGRDWMKEIVSFHKVKLTNSCGNSSNGKFLIHSMHRYQPRIHVVRADDVTCIQYDAMSTFAFPQTVFVTVTAYQNHEVTKLKIENNPFARGFRNEGGKTKNAQLIQAYRPFTVAPKRMMGHPVATANFSKRHKEVEAHWPVFHQTAPHVTDQMTSQPGDVTPMPLAEINNYHRHMGALLPSEQQAGESPVFSQSISQAVVPSSANHQIFTPADTSGGFELATSRPDVTSCFVASQPETSSLPFYLNNHYIPNHSTMQITPSYLPEVTQSSNFQAAESYSPGVTQSSTFQAAESFSPEVTQSSTFQAAESYSPGGTQSSTFQAAESYSPEVTQSSTFQAAESYSPGVTQSSTFQAAESYSPGVTQSSTFQAAESYSPEVTQSSTFQAGESYSPGVTQSSTFQAGESYSPGVTQSSTFQAAESYSPGVTQSSTFQAAESYSPAVTQSSTFHVAESYSLTLSPRESTESLHNDLQSNSSRESAESHSPTYLQNYREDNTFAESSPSYMTSTCQDAIPSFHGNIEQSDFPVQVTSWGATYPRPLAENASPPSDEGYFSTALCNQDEDSAFACDDIKLLLPSSP